MRKEIRQSGEAIIRQGEVGHRFYVIKEGKVDVLREDGGVCVVRATLGAGQFFGETALIDAAFLDAAERDRFGALAIELETPLALVECSAPLDELERRLAARAQSGGDASEADREVLHYQVSHLSPLREAERTRTVSVDTSVPHSAAALCTQLRELLRVS